MSNRLAQETSPYLLQHQNNPVDWYPWGEEALARARTEDKPIVLSVGYSACHWCHVMAHESFESAEIAGVMNGEFINIKVDREERPDLDHIYQSVAFALTRGGGWPLTVFLTPDLKPFFGGTYFPPSDRYGRPGFKRVLESLAQAYKNQKQDILENATKLMEVMGRFEESEPGEGVRIFESPDLAKTWAASTVARILRGVDWNEGGTQGAPKFPSPSTWTFLWRAGRALQDPRAREATLVTLRSIASGGIFDHLRGGFHRYSVDEHWDVPHFEKMLYDQGLLLKLYAEVLLSPEGADLDPATRSLFVDSLQTTVDYLFAEMRSPEGALFAAQDADSEGEEGKFFVWDPAEVARILSSIETDVFCAYFGVTSNGNFEHGKTVLSRRSTSEKVASDLGISVSEVRSILKSAITKTLQFRATRIRPETDTKVLVGWNALAISGLAYASEALAREGISASAERAQVMANGSFTAIRKLAWDSKSKKLFSTIQRGKPKFNGYLDDYSFLALAALDLRRLAKPDERDALADFAAELTDALLSKFVDEKRGGFYFTSDDHEKLVHRPRNIQDSAIPSGVAVALEVLEQLTLFSTPEKGIQISEFLDLHWKKLGVLLSDGGYIGGTAELATAALMRARGSVSVKKTSSPVAVRSAFEPQVAWAAEDGGAGEEQTGALQVCTRGTCQDMSEAEFVASFSKF